MNRSFDLSRRGMHLGLALTIALAGASVAKESDKLVAKAKVTLAQAKAIALKVRPGEITDNELERERGGSGLRYSFDIKSAGKTYEVGVDARDGKILENKIEGPNPD
jgi:uncharacterized membrane protein YkoI